MSLIESTAIELADFQKASESIWLRAIGLNETMPIADSFSLLAQFSSQQRVKCFGDDEENGQGYQPLYTVGDVTMSLFYRTFAKIADENGMAAKFTVYTLRSHWDRNRWSSAITVIRKAGLNPQISRIEITHCNYQYLELPDLAA